MKQSESTMTSRHPNVLRLESACLVVVDVQERFRSVQEHFDDMVRGCVKLVRTFRALDAPVLATEQYPRGLGHTVPELREALGEIDVAEKMVFSCCGSSDFQTRLQRTGATQVLVCGIETHVCVNQTVHDLLERGYAVQVAADAVESRRASDREIGLRKMERSGAVITTCEMAAFELLSEATHPKFKEVQSLFK